MKKINSIQNERILLKNQVLKLGDENKKLSALLGDLEAENSSLKEINRSLSTHPDQVPVEVLKTRDSPSLQQVDSRRPDNSLQTLPSDANNKLKEMRERFALAKQRQSFKYIHD